MSDIQSEVGRSFVRTTMLDAQPPPVRDSGAIGWLRKNLFSTPLNAALTLVGLFLAWSVLRPVVEFAFVNAVWSGDGREACTTEAQGGTMPNGWFGACWAYVGAYLDDFIYGRYPVSERWRINLTFVLFAAGLVPLLIPGAPLKRANIFYMLGIFPIAALILLGGANFDLGPFTPIGAELAGRGAAGFFLDLTLVGAVIAALAAAWASATAGDWRAGARSVVLPFLAAAIVFFILGLDYSGIGLPYVETSLWGGLTVTLIIAITGIAASLPLGILLALGRRSELPIVRIVSIAFIEFWRGVPLITVLFMSSVMLPLFLPEGITVDKLLRALIGVALFASAYMAEVVRGGLQAIGKGQYEGADALGLSYWQKMRLVVLPQALKVVIPGIVNTFIGLFKDTTLVLIIGLFDFLGMIRRSFTDPNWSSPVQAMSAFLFAAAVYFAFCFAMSRYSIYTERRLNTGHKR